MDPAKYSRVAFKGYLFEIGAPMIGILVLVKRVLHARTWLLGERLRLGIKNKASRMKRQIEYVGKKQQACWAGQQIEGRDGQAVIKISLLYPINDFVLSAKLFEARRPYATG
ncbi:hypothetical protein B0O99DRAFT_147108 [Bisporella sp. PMI_857]|nr:hypothetical protein B0O99DRAFT_147108 [Bisporella sp. PMI_857]